MIDDTSLARLLLARGRLPVGTLQALLAEARAEGQGGATFGERLVRRGLLRQDELAALAGELAADPGGGVARAGSGPRGASSTHPGGGARAASEPRGPWSMDPTHAPPRERALGAWATGARVGEYVLGERLGAGGMGEVHLAVHERTGGRYAIKSLPATSDPELLLRFQREGEGLARVDRHPNVVRVHASGEARGRRYIVMELATGGDLHARLKPGPLPAVEVVALGVALASGLAHMHRHGVLHRDLKPHNVLFDAPGPGGRPVLVDFGLARDDLDARSLTQSGQLLGTPAYMAPEQADGRRADVGPATDVYGLGATLFHALTGRPPFDGASPITVLMRVMSEPAPLASSLVPGVPPALDAALRRALAKAPGERYPTAAAFAAALQQATVVEPRRRGLVARAGVGVALLALAAGAIVAAASGPRDAAPPRERATPVAPPTSPPVAPAAPVSSPEAPGDDPPEPVVEPRIEDTLASSRREDVQLLVRAIREARARLAQEGLDALAREDVEALLADHVAKLEAVRARLPEGDLGPPDPARDAVRVLRAAVSTPGEARLDALESALATLEAAGRRTEAQRELARLGEVRGPCQAWALRELARRSAGSMPIDLARASALYWRAADLGDQPAVLELVRGRWRGQLPPEGDAPGEVGRPQAGLCVLALEPLLDPAVAEELRAEAAVTLLEVLRDQSRRASLAASHFALADRIAAGAAALSPGRRARVELASARLAYARQPGAEPAASLVARARQALPHDPAEALDALVELLRAAPAHDPARQDARGVIEDEARTGDRLARAALAVVAIVARADERGVQRATLAELADATPPDAAAHRAAVGLVQALLDAGEQPDDDHWGRLSRAAELGWPEAQVLMITSGRWPSTGPPRKVGIGPHAGSAAAVVDAAAASSTAAVESTLALLPDLPARLAVGAEPTWARALETPALEDDLEVAAELDGREGDEHARMAAAWRKRAAIDGRSAEADPAAWRAAGRAWRELGLALRRGHGVPYAPGAAGTCLQQAARRGDLEARVLLVEARVGELPGPQTARPDDLARSVLAAHEALRLEGLPAGSPLRERIALIAAELRAPMNARARALDEGNVAALGALVTAEREALTAAGAHARAGRLLLPGLTRGRATPGGGLADEVTLNALVASLAPLTSDLTIARRVIADAIGLLVLHGAGERRQEAERRLDALGTPEARLVQAGLLLRRDDPASIGRAQAMLLALARDPGPDVEPEVTHEARLRLWVDLSRRRSAVGAPHPVVSPVEARALLERSAHAGWVPAQRALPQRAGPARPLYSPPPAREPGER